MAGEEQEKKKQKEAKVKAPRMCKTCKQMVFHDSRNCPSKNDKGRKAMKDAMS